MALHHRRRRDELAPADRPGRALWLIAGTADRRLANTLNMARARHRLLDGAHAAARMHRLACDRPGVGGAQGACRCRCSRG
jgi:hypothetical protein